MYAFPCFTCMKKPVCFGEAFECAEWGCAGPLQSLLSFYACLAGPDFTAMGKSVNNRPPQTLKAPLTPSERRAKREALLHIHAYTKSTCLCKAVCLIIDKATIGRCGIFTYNIMGRGGAQAGDYVRRKPASQLQDLRCYVPFSFQAVMLCCVVCCAVIPFCCNC